MSEWVGVLSIVIGFLGGGGSCVTYLLYRKQSARIKNAEAFGSEVVAWQQAIETLKKQVDWQGHRIESLQLQLIQSDSKNTQLLCDKNVLEIKNAKNKSAINRAYECGMCDDVSKCPVLKQRTKNEEDYLKEIKG